MTPDFCSSPAQPLLDLSSRGCQGSGRAGFEQIWRFAHSKNVGYAVGQLGQHSSDDDVDQ